VYRVELRFDDMKDLESNLGISSKRLAQLFSDYYVPTLMGETLKQFKKAE